MKRKTSCGRRAEVGSTKTLANNTGQVVNGFRWVIQGLFALISHSDGPYYDPSTGLAVAGTTFSGFTSHPSGGNTILEWSGVVLAPGAKIRVGFTAISNEVVTLGASWTNNGIEVGCARQVSLAKVPLPLHPHQLNPVSFHRATPCGTGGSYVGNFRFEWHIDEVPLTELGDGSARNPMQTDVIPGSALLVPADGAVSVDMPDAPVGANYAIVRYTVGSSSGLGDAS